MKQNEKYKIGTLGFIQLDHTVAHLQPCLIYILCIIATNNVPFSKNSAIVGYNMYMTNWYLPHYTKKLVEDGVVMSVC